MTQSTGTRKRPFYGWLIVAGGFLIMATCYTAFVNCISLFQSNVVGDLDITVGGFNTGVSLCTIMAVFASLVIGKLIDKWDVRKLGAITVITSTLCLALFSCITQLWQLYVLCVIAGTIVVAGTRLLVSVLISNWFTLRRGLAVSIALSGSGVGGMILTQLTSNVIAGNLLYSVTPLVIDGATWRVAFLLLAAICLVFGLPLVVIAFRNHPSDMGLQPYGEEQVEVAQADKSPDKPVLVSIGWSVLKKSWAFWLLVIGFVMMGIDNGAIITNSISNMTSVPVTDEFTVITGGHSAVWAGNVWTLYLAVVIVAKISLGAIYDRWGLKVGTLLGTFTSFAAAVALCFPQTVAGPILAAVFFGFGTCMGTVAPPMMTVKEFGKKDLGTLTGIVTAFEMLGAAIGSVISGILFDAYLSFVPAWIMVMVATVIMGVTLLASITHARRLVARRVAEGAPMLDANGNDLPRESEGTPAAAE